MRSNPEGEDPVEPEPEPAHDVEPEKDQVAAGSRCKRSTAPGCTRRKPTKKLTPSKEFTGRRSRLKTDACFWVSQEK